MTLTLAMLLLFASPSFAKSEEGIVNRANKLYNEGKYDEALEGYSEAEVLSPESGPVNFNKGAALYKKYGFDEALGYFSRVLSTHNPELEARTSYNIGNSKYKLATSLGPDKQGTAMRLYKEALDYYKRAIELDGQDQDAKFNYEFVEKELKALEENRQEQKDKQDQDKDQDQEEEQEGQSGKNREEQEQKDDKDEKGQGAEDQEKEQKEERKEEQEEEQEQQQDENSRSGEQGRDEEDDDAGESEEEEQQEGQMSDEEARMLLDAYGQQEEPETKVKKRKAQYEVLKDW
ncbi:MAG: hypothetical protein ABH875_01825 [Candidatus Omnitrophota bacterium]